MDAAINFGRFPFNLVPLVGRDDEDLVADSVHLFGIESLISLVADACGEQSAQKPEKTREVAPASGRRPPETEGDGTVVELPSTTTPSRPFERAFPSVKEGHRQAKRSKRDAFEARKDPEVKYAGNGSHGIESGWNGFSILGNRRTGCKDSIELDRTAREPHLPCIAVVTTRKARTLAGFGGAFSRKPSHGERAYFA